MRAVTIAVLVVCGVAGALAASLDATRARADAVRFRAGLIRDGTSAESADWVTWNTFYYADPKPDRTVAAIHFLSDEGALQRTQQPHAAFFGSVFAQNRGAVPQWIDELRSAPEEERFFAALALWFSGIPDRDRLLRRLADGGSSSLEKYVDELLADASPDVASIEIRRPVEIDMTWASFFATGDTRYVDRVIRIVTAPSEQQPAETVQAARWSLISIARAHSVVVAACREYASRHPETADVLNDVVTKAGEEPKETGPRS